MAPAAPYRRHFDIAAKLAETRDGGVPFQRATFAGWLTMSDDDRRPLAQRVFASQPIAEPDCALAVASSMFEGLADGTAIEIPGFDEGETFTFADLAMYVYFCDQAPLDAGFIEAMRWLFIHRGITHYVRKAVDGQSEEVAEDTAIFSENLKAVAEVSHRQYFSQLAHVLERFIITGDDTHVCLIAPEMLRAIAEIENSDHQPDAEVQADIKQYKARVYFAYSSSALTLEEVYVDPKTKEELTCGDLHLRGMECAYGVNTDQLRRPRPTYSRPTRREVAARVALFAAIVGGVFSVSRRFTS